MKTLVEVFSIFTGGKVTISFSRNKKIIFAESSEIDQLRGEGKVSEERECCRVCGGEETREERPGVPAVTTDCALSILSLQVAGGEVGGRWQVLPRLPQHSTRPLTLSVSPLLNNQQSN